MKDNLQKISSMRAIFNYKECLSELQSQFPSSNNSPYKKSFFIKLHKLISAKDEHEELAKSAKSEKARKKFIVDARECAIEKLHHNGEVSEINNINHSK